MLAPGATIGMLGGGQLGRMMALAAARLGLKTHVYSPDTDSPAFDVCAACTVASYADEASLVAFAQTVDVVTYEFENVPARSAAVLAEHRPVRPGPAALAASQERLTEKDFLNRLGIATAPYAAVDDLASLRAAMVRIGLPAILKTRRFGYDGKGQVPIRVVAEAEAALAAIGRAPAILEGFVPFTREISVVAARGLDGAFAAYDIGENVHADHILDTTHVPAAIAPETAEAAIAIARRIADALDYHGVLAVEMFVTTGQDAGGQPFEALCVNETAPRVHNSGHWTLDGAVVSQFEQHIRAICGWPLGLPRRLGARVSMRNLVGDQVLDWAALLAEPGACLHLYGKPDVRPGRKMGHVTRVLNDPPPD